MPQIAKALIFAQKAEATNKKCMSEIKKTLIFVQNPEARCGMHPDIPNLVHPPCYNKVVKEGLPWEMSIKK